MLVTTRRIGEKLVIGDGIVLTIMEIRGRKVRIGLVAPASVRVARAEPLLPKGSRIDGHDPLANEAEPS